jgi:hypothetical protein
LEAVVDNVKRRRAAESMPLGLSFSHLKSLLYDVNDFVDELDYFRLHHHVDDASSNDTVKIDNPVNTKRLRVYKSSRHNTTSRGECTPPQLRNHPPPDRI